MYKELETSKNQRPMKWYNVELFNSHEIKAFKALLKSMSVKFECSECFSGIH